MVESEDVKKAEIDRLYKENVSKVTERHCTTSKITMWQKRLCRKFS